MSQWHICVLVGDVNELLAMAVALKRKESKNDKVVVKEKDRQTRTPSPSGQAFMQYKSKTNV